MTVEKLIAELSKLDPKTKVILGNNDYCNLKKIILGSVFEEGGGSSFKKNNANRSTFRKLAVYLG